MDFMNGLNKEQTAAVLTRNQHVRIIAGAGSGKTRVLTTRIVYLIQEVGIFPSKICAITFTNKAANEMKERMEKMSMEASRVHTSTIHALCVRVLREDYEAVNLPRNFIILDTQDQQTIMREAYKNYGYDRKELPFREVLGYIADNKFAHISVEQAKVLAGSNFHDVKKAKVYEYYVMRLKELYALDFDDLLLVVQKVLKENQSVREKWQHRFNVILVDEFQDVDAVQYSIVQSLTGEKNALYVVGDPDQTIYTWRGADVNFITDFEKAYPKSETIVLNQNYRSTQHILDKANTLIGNNKDRPKKELHANKQSDVDVVYESLDDSESESFWVARKIEELKDETGSYLDTAVLYRSNYLSRSLEKALMARHIPYVIYGGMRFFDRAEVKDLMSYLRMITHADDLALRRSVSVPRRGIGDKTLDTIQNDGIQSGMTMFEVMQDRVKHGNATAKIASYVRQIEDYQDKAKQMDIEGIMQYVLKTSGLREHFEKNQELERMESLNELISDAQSFQKNYEDPSLESYIQMVSLYGDREEVVSGDYVRLMTVHAAKGLEFDNVIVMGVSDNVFPNKNSVMEGQGGIQEERRLMYVAITRARDQLFVTSNSGYSFVMGGYGKPSRFIQEMGLSEVSAPIDFDLGSYRDTSRDEYEEILQSSQFKKSDVVIHDEFGEGIVIRAEEDTMRIAFNFPHGTKTISTRFAGIRKKGTLS